MNSYYPPKTLFNMTSIRNITLAVILSIFVGLIAFFIGQKTSNQNNANIPRSDSTDIRKEAVERNQKVFDLLKTTPFLKLNPLTKQILDTITHKPAEKTDPRLSIYSILVNQSIAVTPTAAFSDFIGTISNGRIYEFTGEPTLGHPATGYIYIQGVPTGTLQNLESFGGVCLIDVPAGQKYLIDFLVSMVNDGVTNPQSNWVLMGNAETVAQTTPAVPSPLNTSQDQHVFFVIETAGDHFTFAEISNQSPNGTNSVWTYEGATITRIQ
jgi:hypothetical protein